MVWVMKSPKEFKKFLFGFSYDLFWLKVHLLGIVQIMGDLTEIGLLYKVSWYCSAVWFIHGSFDCTCNKNKTGLR